MGKPTDPKDPEGAGAPGAPPADAAPAASPPAPASAPAAPAAPVAPAPDHLPKLLVKNGFTAFGVTYGVGDIIPAKDVSKWPKDALANRMAGGDVEYKFPGQE